MDWNKDRQIRLFIVETGDRSVGIFEQEFMVTFPYMVNTSKLDEEDKDNLEIFRSAILNTYKEFAEMRIYAEYDYERKLEMDEEDKFFKFNKETTL